MYFLIKFLLIISLINSTIGDGLSVDKHVETCDGLSKKDFNICWRIGCELFNHGYEHCAPALISCETKDYEKCICSHSHCDFHDPDKCSQDHPGFKDLLTCRRPNSYYVYHPKIFCYNSKQSGNCYGTVIYAVNLNGEDYVDQQKISYIADKSSLKIDPDNIGKPYKHEKSCENKEDGVSKNDWIYLIEPYVLGDLSKNPSFDQSKWLSYLVPICQNGEYELAIKVAESYHYLPDKRCFDVRINDVPIMIDIDPYRLAGNKSCYPSTLIVGFVADGEYGNIKGDKALYLKGRYEPIMTKNGEFELQFHFGLCKQEVQSKDPSFTISSFSLFRFGDDTKECGLDAFSPRSQNKTKRLF